MELEDANEIPVVTSFQEETVTVEEGWAKLNQLKTLMRRGSDIDMVANS